MPDDPAPAAAANDDLDDLERRLAAFENATRRLNRTVGGIAEPATVGHASPPKRAVESARQGREEISGLRPAVAAQGAQTGALTARNRAASAGTAGFTSAYGKPAIPPPVVATARQAAASPPPRLGSWASSFRITANRQALLILAAGGALAALLTLASLPRLFPSSMDGIIAGRTLVVAAPNEGVLCEVLRSPGSQVVVGDVLARIEDASLGNTVSVVATVDGEVARLHLAAGRRVTVGQPLFDIAMPGSLFAIAALSPSTFARVSVGDRVEVRLIGDARVADGTIAELVPAGGSASTGLTLERDPRPRAIVALDPSSQPPRLGQGTRIIVVGTRPGLLRLTLLRLRGLVPW